MDTAISHSGDAEEVSASGVSARPSPAPRGQSLFDDAELEADLAALRSIEVRLGTDAQQADDVPAANAIAHRLANRLVRSSILVHRELLERYGIVHPKKPQA